MSEKTMCICGALYRRIEEPLARPDHGECHCRVCGETLESWSGRTQPVYLLEHRPEGG